MEPNILCVNPYIHDFTAYDLWMKPLGLYWIAAFLEKYGYKVSFIDCVDRFHPQWLKKQGLIKPKSKKNGCGSISSKIIQKPSIYSCIPRYYRRFGMSPEVLSEILKSIPTPQAIVVTSMMTYWYPGVVETIQILRQHFPSVPIALGGVYATLCTEHAEKVCGADIVFPGLSEMQLLRWLGSITGNNAEIPEQNEIKAEDLPMPAHHFLHSGSSAVIATSLGCPLKCTYCASRILQPKYRQRPIPEVINEIFYLVHKKRVHNIAFYDDALLINAENHLIPLLEQLKHHAWAVHFHASNGLHASLITPKIAKLFLEAKVDTLRFSYERTPVFAPGSIYSSEDPALHQALAYLYEAAGNEYKIQPEVYVKVFLPDQTVEDIVDGLIYVHQQGGYIKLADYSPVPHTQDFEKIMAKYNIDPQEPLYQNKTTLPIFMGYSEEETVHPIKSLVKALNSSLDHGVNLFAGKNKIQTTFLKSISKLINL
ncbi:MAG: radical SAM protein [Planctomycetes bacterium]|jgi:hypothetical protein|nr:radical SAM protein [Planctomycetota bacterium]